jgi:hypothetical protein
MLFKTQQTTPEKNIGPKNPFREIPLFQKATHSGQGNNADPIPNERVHCHENIRPESMVTINKLE